MGEVASVGSGGRGTVAARLAGDEALARMAARGDACAFAAIYERHHQELYRYCRSLCGDADDASDALQSTMTAALRSLPGETRSISLRPWLFRIAHNESVSLIRKRRPHAALAEAPPIEAPGPERHASVRERLGRLLSDLRELPERQRGALVMRELNGLGYEEIGAALGVSAPGARQAVYEARAALHELADGRDMGCAAAKRRISAQDGRMLRGRKLRAHLRACNDCRAFSEQLSSRRAALRSLAPPLPAGSAAAILAGLVGAGGGTGAGGAAAGGGIASLASTAFPQAAGGSAAVKGVAAVALAVVAGVGTAEVASDHRGTHRASGAEPVVAAAGGEPRRGASSSRPVYRLRRVARRAHAGPSGDRHRVRVRAPQSPRLPSLAPKRQPGRDGSNPPPQVEPLPPPAEQPPDPPAPPPAGQVPPAPAPDFGRRYSVSIEQATLAAQIRAQIYARAMTATREILSRILRARRDRS